jgi:predicted transcriptional regulator
MDTENQAKLAFEEDCTRERLGEAVGHSDSGNGAEPSTDDLVTPSEMGGCSPFYVLAKDIQFDPALHERRAFSEDDLAQAKAVVAQEHLIAPLKVVKRGNSLFLIDGFVSLQAIIALDPDAVVKVVQVDQSDALAIRLADTRHRRKREPMAPARQALARYRAGISQDAIAKELGVSAGNVSQMISAAETEEEFEKLAELLPERSKISRNFWFDFYTTTERLKKADQAEPDSSSPNMERFKRSVDDLIADGQPISVDDVRAKLRINSKRGQPKRRNRVLGKPVRRRGLKTKICVDRERQGGPIINFEPGYPAKDFEAALEALLTFLTNPDAASPPRT